jgi:hypothetical protein
VGVGLRPTQKDENDRRRHPRVSGGLAEELHADRLIMKRLSFCARRFLAGEESPQLSFALS